MPRPIARSTTATSRATCAPARSGSSASAARSSASARTASSRSSSAVGEVKAVGRRMFAGFVRDVSAREAEQRCASFRPSWSTSRAFGHGRDGLGAGARAQSAAHRDHQLRPGDAAPDRDGTRTSAGALSWACSTRPCSRPSRAGQIISRLRQFVAKGETERMLEDVNAVVEEASALALIGTAGRGIAVRGDFAPKLPPVLMDKIQIHQVVTNLVRNSVDALEGASARGIVICTRRAAPAGRDLGRRQRARDRARDRRPALPALRHDQARRHGHRAVDLPVDRRGARRQAGGEREPGRRSGVLDDLPAPANRGLKGAGARPGRRDRRRRESSIRSRCCSRPRVSRSRPTTARGPSWRHRTGGSRVRRHRRRMPDMDGLELIAALRRRGPLPPVIVITGHGDVPMAVRR